MIKKLFFPALGLMAFMALGINQAPAGLFGTARPETPATTAKTASDTTPSVTVGPDFSVMAEKLLPTVVNVSTTQSIKEQAMPEMPEFPPGSPFEDFFKDFYERHKNAPQMPAHPTSLGSGFVIDAKEGYIVTNNHVIRDADEIKVILHDDTAIPARLVGTDEKTDIAVLQIKTEKPLAAINWGNSDEAKVGSWTLVIGNPFGLGGTVTAGIISARQRDINAGPYDDFIQTDASINRGNSGGPMFNMKGEVIGVSTAIFSPTGGSVGIGFAVPSNLAHPVVEQLIKFGKTRRGWLGVRIQAVTDDIAESLGLKETAGALISSVTADGPAGKAGIESGDVIIAFNGQPIKQMRQLPRIVAETEVGKKVPVTLLRKGKERTVNVTLGQLEKAEEDGLVQTAEKEDEPQKAEMKLTKVPEIGLGLTPLTDELKARHDIRNVTKGVVVAEVEQGSPAAEKGLQPGDVIVEVDQEEVANPAEVTARVSDAKKAGHSSVLLFMARQGDMRFVAVKLDADTKKKKAIEDEETDHE